MKGAIAFGYTLCFAMILAEASRAWFGFGSIGVSFVWIGGIFISLIPFIRTVALAFALSVIIPWWGAIPAAVGINTLRFFLLLVTDPARKIHLQEQKARFEEMAQKHRQV